MRVSGAAVRSEIAAALSPLSSWSPHVIRSVAAVAACGLFLALGAGAAQSDTPENKPRIPTIYTQDVSSFRTGGPAAQLVRKAREEGQLTVLVGLRTVARMEHTLSPTALAAQRSVLRKMQDSIVARVFDTPPRRVDRFTFIPYMALYVDADELERLLADPDVASVHEDILLHPRLDDSVPLIHADDVVAKNVDGEGWVVAVLDTGVDRTHKMLKPNKVVSEACYSRHDPPNAVSLCVDSNGHKVEELIGPGSAEDCAFRGCDHGTHVAAIAAGNPVGALTGVAPGAQIIAIQVNHRTTDDPPRIVTSIANAVKGLERVYKLRRKFDIAAANISLGAPSSNVPCDSEDDAMTMAIEALRARGIATIAPAGNDHRNSIDFPACVSSAIAVGNTTKQDVLWRNSNLHALVKLLAPGRNIRSAIPGGGYKEMTGTSQAAPHVAGAFALLRKVVPAKAAASIDQILGALACSGKPIDRRLNAAGDVVEVATVKPRIDVLGAYDFLKKPPDALRRWLFNDASDAGDWAPFRGGWKVSGGNYVQTPISSGWVAASVANCDARLEVSVRMRRVDPSTAFYNTGIFVKSSLDHVNETVSGYQFLFNSVTNPSPTKPGEAVVWKINQQNLDTGAWVSGSKVIGCEKDVEVNVNKYNTIRIVSDGATHSYYLNGKLVCTFSDATFSTGAVAIVGALPDPPTGHSISVDTVSIKPLGTVTSGALEASTMMNPAALAPQPPDGSTPEHASAGPRS